MINTNDLEEIKSTKYFYTRFAPTEEKAVEKIGNYIQFDTGKNSLLTL